ncbi:transcription intermediary factor 1-alpha-like [Mercenaria mercenaria]|uniref:transcription intermediary factor 1-alpha-like n=1 Tax=Mercenaria mercenaria TaxID=6596 RepID=UPI00234ED4A8|nr:transcription intermediary factor 1-alpha-like [Mercenaria mercenaria]
MVAMGYCQNCNEYFCSACLKFHRKQSMSRNHVVLEGKSMPNFLVPGVDVEPCSELCSMHTNEIVKFYCSSHDKIGCGDCMVLKHKACKVERTQDISCSYFNGPQHKKLVETVGQFLQNLEDLGACIQLAEEDMNASYSKAMTDINTFRKEVNIYLDEAEAEIMAEVNNWKKKNGKTFSELNNDKISIQNEIKELEEKLKLQSKKANELFMAAKQMKERMITIDTSIKQMFQKGQTQSFMFEPSSEIKQIISSKLPLGKLAEEIIKRNTQNKHTLDDMEPQFDGEINIKTPEDKSDCSMIASALISPSQIVLADYNNKCLKMVDIEQRKLSTRHELFTEPVDVAVVSRNLIAVTLPHEQKIQFLSITQKNTLTESHDINVNGTVRKIACQNDKLIIGYTDKIEILNMKGHVVKTISSPCLSWIAGIAFSHDSLALFVSDGSIKKSSVYKFDFDGNILATYNDKTPVKVGGLTVTPDGTVLVCNWTRNGSIHMISPACKKIKEILQQNEHVQSPYSVSFCCQTNRLFLSNSKGSIAPELKNALKIFQMM